MDEVSNTTSHNLWHNLKHEGDKDATIQCLDLARRIKNQLNPNIAHKKRKRVEAQQETMQRLLDKFKPGPISDQNTWAENQKNIQLQKELCEF